MSTPSSASSYAEQVTVAVVALSARALPALSAVRRCAHSTDWRTPTHVGQFAGAWLSVFTDPRDPQAIVFVLARRCAAGNHWTSHHTQYFTHLSEAAVHAELAALAHPAVGPYTPDVSTCRSCATRQANAKAADAVET